MCYRQSYKQDWTVLDSAIRFISSTSYTQMMQSLARSTGISWRNYSMTEKENILQTADRLTSGEKRKAYGPCSTFYVKLARMWSVVLSKEVTPHEAALMMILFKVVRENTNH